MNSFRSISSLIVYALCIAGSLRAQTQPADNNSADLDGTTPHRVPGVVYVQFREGYNPMPAPGMTIQSVSTIDAVQKIFREIGVTRIEQFDKDAWKNAVSHRIGIDRMYVVYYSTDAHPLGVTLRLLQTGQVQSASPRYIFTPQTTHNDPLIGSQWYLDTVRADSAWAIATTEGTGITIADVDEGVNYNHEDLAANMVDHGYNAASGGVGDAMPAPGASEGEHGTETTGCFGAVIDNGKGIAGVAPKCKILAVKIANDQGQLTAGYEGINYAATHGANIINCSWGGTINAAALAFEQQIADVVTGNNEILVASAGNYAKNNDITPFYPACLDGVLSVGSSNNQNRPSPFTHFGTSVLCYAPGEQITTTTLAPGNTSYTDAPPGGVAGTSFSGPIAAGVCGLLMSLDNTLPADAVKKIVIQTGDPIDAQGRPDLFTGKRVNALTAVNSVSHSTIPNVAPTGYTLNGVANGILDKYNVNANLDVTFKNSGADDQGNISATLEIGSGYTWAAFDPKYPTVGLNWPLGFMDQKGSNDGKYSTVQRTKQFSEGSATLKFALYDQTNYRDTVSIVVPLTPQPGMLHTLESPHATCLKQVDSVNAWAGFGYWVKTHDPERGDTVFEITQYARRHRFGDGKTGWDVSPTDMDLPEVPISCIEALDSNTVWFGGGTTLSNTLGKPTNQIMFTNDGGATWQANGTNLPVTPKWIHFADANNGMFMGDAIGTSFQRYVTTNGGQDWSLQALPIARKNNERVFNNGAYWNGSFGMFGGNAGYVYVTTNGGSSWTANNVVNPLIGTINPKWINVESVCYSPDKTVGFALIRPDSGSADSAALYYCYDSKGVNWYRADMLNPNTASNDPLRIPYSVTFKPGTDSAIVTTNQGIFVLGYTGNNTSSSTPFTWDYFPAPSTWNSSYSTISAAGTKDHYTISAASDGSGIVDFSTQPLELQAVHSNQSVSELQVIASPNPSAGTSQLFFSLTNDEQVQIKLLDVLGRTVRDVFAGFMASGDHAVQVESGELPAGVYHCVLETAHGQTSEASIVLMR